MLLPKSTPMASPSATNSDPLVLEIQGEIDLHQAPQVKAQIEPLLEKKPAHFSVDLSRVEYMDSSGLALLIETMQRIQSYGGKFTLFGLSQSVRAIFEIARLDQIFQIYPSREAALAAS